MDSKTWSTLPLELLINIINHTDDAETLISWHKATIGSSYLHRIARNKRWKKVIIDKRDLIPAPGNDLLESQEKDQALKKLAPDRLWKPVGKGVLELLQESRNGFVPAKHVEEIVLDFRMLLFCESFIQSGPAEPFEIMPSDETLEHTIALLMPLLVNVRQVEVSGNVPQTLLNAILSFNPSNIQSLKVRTPKGYGAFVYNSQSNRRSNFQWLSFASLFKLQRIQVLDVHDLRVPETDRLAKAIPKLKCLKQLTVSDMEVDHSDLNTNGCGVRTFLRRLLTAEYHDVPDVLPPSLTSLSLIDTGMSV
jgi:hypothetical protein